MVEFLIHPMVFGGQVDEWTTLVLDKLLVLIDEQHENTAVVSERMLLSFDDLEFVVRTLGLTLLIGGLLIAFFTVQSIVRPVQ